MLWERLQIPFHRSLAVGLGSKVSAKRSFLWKKSSGHVDPAHGIGPSECFLLIPVSRPPGLTQDPSIGHFCSSLGAERKEGRDHRCGHFPPLILVSPHADELVFRFPGIHFFLQTQPTFSVPRPLALMNFILKEQFLSGTWSSRGGGQALSVPSLEPGNPRAKDRVNPPECFPTLPQAAQALAASVRSGGCSSPKDPLFLSVPGAVRSPALGSVH